MRAAGPIPLSIYPKTIRTQFITRSQRRKTESKAGTVKLTAAIPTVAIHRGDDETDKPASIEIKQGTRQEPFQEDGVHALCIGKAEATEPMAGMKKIQGGEPAVIGGGRTIHGGL